MKSENELPGADDPEHNLNEKATVQQEPLPARRNARKVMWVDLSGKTKNSIALKVLYSKFTKVVGVFLFPIGLLFIFFADEKGGRLRWGTGSEGNLPGGLWGGISKKTAIDNQEDYQGQSKDKAFKTANLKHWLQKYRKKRIRRPFGFLN